MSKSLRVRRKLYGRTKSTSSGSATPPAGADGAIQYNNGGAFGGFGTWDDTLLRLILNADFFLDDSADFIMRESAAQQYRKFEIVAVPGVTTQAGNYDYNAFRSDTITDAIATVLLFGQGIKSDGAEGISKLISASFRKDGVADPVQMGANSDLVSKEDSPNTPTMSIGLGLAGTDNIRISFDSNSVGVNYTWTFWMLIAYTKV